MSLLEFIAVLEVIIINCLVVSKCTRHKYGNFINITVLTVFTAAIFGVGFFYIHLVPSYGNGNGLFVLFGFLYLMPLKILSEERLSRMFILICMPWTYTLSVFSFAVQIGKFFPAQQFTLAVVLVETAAFLLGTRLVFRHIVSKYIYILDHTQGVGSGWGKYLSATSILHFFTLLGINLVFSMERASLLKPIVILLVMAAMFLTYHVLYSMVKHGEKMQLLNERAHHDLLTGLKNRLSMMKDMEVLQQTHSSFYILFMDLNRFKEVNDRFGHVVGDAYLRHFACVTSSQLGEDGTVYRYGGDEFVAIYQGEAIEETLSGLHDCRNWDENAPCPFNEVSIGYILCTPPHDSPEELLRRVDRKMYEEKARVKGARGKD